jgi:hypothetical protein
MRTSTQVIAGLAALLPAADQVVVYMPRSRNGAPRIDVPLTADTCRRTPCDHLDDTGFVEITPEMRELFTEVLRDHSDAPAVKIVSVKETTMLFVDLPGPGAHFARSK